LFTKGIIPLDKVTKQATIKSGYGQISLEKREGGYPSTREKKKHPRPREESLFA
jgi:hypothetical protein